MKVLKNKNKLKYVDLYGNSGEENHNNLNSNQVSISKHVKDRKNFSYKKQKLFLNQSLPAAIEKKELVREG